jgi:hypothetical protein
MSDRVLHAELAAIVAEAGCPLIAAARHPEFRDVLMELNADLERGAPEGTAEGQERVLRALEDVLRARARRARRGA